MLGRLRVRDRIAGMVVVFMLGLSALCIVNILSERDMLLREKKLKTRHLVEAAHGILAHYARQEAQQTMTRAQAMATALEAVRAMRYEDAGYFWVNDLNVPIPRMVMHPTLPALQGKLLDAPEYDCATSLQAGDEGAIVRTDGRMNLFLAFNEVVRKHDRGYVTYQWPKPLPGGGATQENYPKLSYVMHLPEWDWVIGTGIYIDDVDRIARTQMLQSFLLVGGLGGALILLAAWLGGSIVRPLATSAEAFAAMTQGRRPLGPLPVECADEIGTLITGFNHLQESLKEREEKLRLAASVFENAREGILITDPVGRIIGVNPSFTALTGYTREEVLGKNPSLLKSGHQGDDFYRQMWESLVTLGYWQGEIWNRRKDGQVYVEMLTITTVHDTQGFVSHFLGIFSDVTALKEHQRKLEHLAHFDPLTQLPNRTLLADRLQLALIQAARTQELLAVAFLDLDEFKPVNDRLGHDAGDQLLVEVAQRLKNSVRAGDTVARLGGDEFVLLLIGLKDTQEAHAAFERVLVALAEPFLLKNEPVSVSASIGVTLYPLDEADAEVLLRHADQAMYAAKQAGRNCYRVFDPQQDLHSRTDRPWRTDIGSTPPRA